MNKKEKYLELFEAIRNIYSDGLVIGKDIRPIKLSLMDK